MEPMGSIVYMTGSRALSDEYGPVMDRVISALAGSGASIAVTCAAGAEAMALMRASGLGSLSAVFAVGDATGSGFWAGSCPFSLLSCWGRDRVRWMTGDDLRLPLPVRLNNRTRACFRFTSSGGPGGRLVAFCAAPDCPDTLAACRQGLSFGLTVIVFPCGFPAAELPLLTPEGQWVCAGPHVWADAVRWTCSRPTIAPAAILPEHLES